MYQTIWRGRSHPTQSQSSITKINSFFELIEGAVPILWEEHCTECAVPECYDSCQLFVRREDKKCARFVEGIFPNTEFAGLFPFGADIQFRRWGKLQAKLPTSHHLLGKEEIRAWSKSWSAQQDKSLKLSRKLDILDPSRKLVGASRLLQHKKLEQEVGEAQSPDMLLIECFLDGIEPKGLILEASSGDLPSFRRIFHLDPGWNSFKVNYANLGMSSGSKSSLELSIDRDETARLIFTYLDFVRLKDRAKVPAEKIKCLAWDLDNTLWNGVVGDDGSELELIPLAASLIKEMDSRGIIQVVLSKNEEETAMNALRKFKLDNFFVGHKIDWNPKSANLGALAKELNIGIDSFALIDDSAFERREVSGRHPSVRLYRPGEMEAIGAYEEFDVIRSTESVHRRERYLDERVRKDEKSSWKGDYEAFLRSCSQVLKIGAVGEKQVERSLELLQRSNQFNLSGKRYDKDSFDDLKNDPGYFLKYLELTDRHGSYGIVGFCSYKIEGESIRVLDFVFSCRAAEKKIERAFFETLFKIESKKSIVAALTATPRNAPLRRVLGDMGFKETGFDHGTEDIVWDCPDDFQNIVEVILV